MAGYLFVHFIGEEKDGEQIYFAASEDGMHWEDLNGGKPVLYSKIGELGVRDPFLVRDEKRGKFYLIATDLRIEAGKGWEVAQYQGSRNIIIWESENLIDWSQERSYEIGVHNAGCVWAPEAVYDKEKDAFMVFWASMTKLEGDMTARQRIYASYTTDFQHFTEPQIYIDNGDHIIDTTIAYEDGWYYLISKDESVKKINIERKRTLDSAEKEEVYSEVLDGFLGLEGPEIYQLPDKRWCLIVDQFAAKKGYLPLIATSLEKADFRIAEANSYNLGKNRKRHGGVLMLTDEEYKRIKNAFKK